MGCILNAGRNESRGTVLKEVLLTAFFSLVLALLVSSDYILNKWLAEHMKQG